MTADDDSYRSSPLTFRRSLVEWLAVLAVFVLYAAEPTPSVNEAHYLAKARHYWNPAWCSGDLFLESADAHAVFYWTFGWLTRVVSLPAAAWIGRLVTWSALSWCWRRLSWAVVPRWWIAPLSAALFVSLIHEANLAGEWVIGGVEAKGFAYILLFAALHALVNGRWRIVWPLLGAASAFHVLTGGWGVVAAGFAWLIAGRRDEPLVRIAPWLVGGLVLALPGLVPAILLTVGTPRDVVREANHIYVFERLSHHLVFHTLPREALARHLAMIAAWIVLAWKVRCDVRSRRLTAFTAGAALIALSGAAVDRLLIDQPDTAASLLRFYWFRLSDAMIPVGASLAICTLLVRVGEGKDRSDGADRSDTAETAKRARRNDADAMPAVSARSAKWIRAGGLTLAGVAAACTIGGVANQHLLDRRGGADAQSLPAYPTHPEFTAWVYEDWQATTAWIHENTPADATFLTPRSQQTFLWYAGRPEAANWKNVPQDAAGVVEWKRRMDRIYPPTELRGEWDQFTDDDLRSIGREFGATYLVLDRTRHPPRRKMTRVYPPKNTNGDARADNRNRSDDGDENPDENPDDDRSSAPRESLYEVYRLDDEPPGD